MDYCGKFYLKDYTQEKECKYYIQTGREALQMFGVSAPLSEKNGQQSLTFRYFFLFSSFK